MDILANVQCDMNINDIIEQFQANGHSGLPAEMKTNNTVPIDTRTDLAIWEESTGKISAIIVHFFRGTQSRPAVDKYVKGLGALMGNVSRGG